MVTTRTIEQTVTFRANPHDVSEALTDSEQHSQFTEAQANISREVGSSLTAYPMKDGYTRPSPTATFLLENIPGGTRLIFVQTGVPEQSYDQINQGWQIHYWPKMKGFLESWGGRRELANNFTAEIIFRWSGCSQP